MKRYIQSAIILLAALSLTGCSKTEEFEHNPDNALQIESVSGISPFALMQEPASKAVITGETLPGDEATKGIGLFVTAQGGGAYDGKTTGYSNVKYAYSNSKWSAASPIYLSNTSGKLYGYFPYSTAATDLKAIPVESSLNSTDYLYATSQDVSFSNKSVNLQMNHALARLHLTIKKGDKYLSNCNLSKIILQSKAIDASGTMDITTGTITATKAADATGTFILTGTDAATKTGIEKDILLVPANNVEGKKDLILTLTIDGVDAEVNFTADKGLDIRSGIQCNATLTIEDTGIKVTGVGIGVWGDGGSQTVQVSGHTVTVKFSEDTGIVDDVVLQAKPVGNSVKISAVSRTKKELSCSRSDIGIIPSTSADTFHDFLIDNVSTDIIATISYFRKTAAQEFTTVNGHKVTVSVADGAENDIVKSVRLIDNKVVIETNAVSELPLMCTLTGTAEASKSNLGHNFTFTISDISSNIDAVLGYHIVTITVSSDSNGKVWIGDDEGKTSGQFYFGQQVVLHATPNENFILFRWDDNNRQTIRTVTLVGEDNVEYSASFISSDLIPGLFTVKSDGKQVFFSKGNLWADSNNALHFEANQYAFNSSYQGSHVSHFTWSSTVEAAVGNNNSGDYLFCDESHKVSVDGSDAIYYALSTEEWQYLFAWNSALNEGNGDFDENLSRYGLFKFGVSVCGKTNCLVLLPDDWEWDESTVGTGWQTGGYPETATESNPVAWQTMEDAGAVCLPAADSRNGSSVGIVGYDGDYWSSTGHSYGYLAYFVNFSSSNVSPGSLINRGGGFSVRLITESN